MRLLQKQRWRDGGDGEGHFFIATNISVVNCALQWQHAYPCLLWTLHYPSTPWSFRNRIVFFVMNRSYLSHNQISASKHSNWIVGFKNISHRGCFLRSSKLIQLLVMHHQRVLQAVVLARLISISRYLVLYSYSISEPAGFTIKLKFPTVKSSHAQIIFQRFSVQ